MPDKSKIAHQQKGLEKGDIFPIKGVFSWTQSKELLTSQLYKNLQRAISPKEHLFQGNNSLFKKNDSAYNRKIYELFQSYIIIDPDKLPENFIKLFELDTKSPDIQIQVESLFKKARLLEKDSARIVFVDDKIIIFRNEERLVHTTGKLTQGEKKRSEIRTTFNTFSNIYDAVRSQYHAIDGSEQRKDDYRLYQQDILKLAQEIKVLGYGVKDGEFARRLNTLITQTERATNAKVLGANLQNLQELTFTNTSIDSKLLEGAKNKLYKRFKDLQNKIGIITNQLLDLENILIEHQNALDIFISQITFASKEFSIDNYNKAYIELEKKFGKISPFSIFHDRIMKYATDKDLFPKYMIRMSGLYEVFKKEHQEKLSGKITNTQLFESFKDIKDNLPFLETLD